MNLRTMFHRLLPERGFQAAALAAAAAAAAMLNAAVLSVLLPRAAQADATTYSTTKRQFKVGVLLIDSTVVLGQEARGPENPDPYLFYIADSRIDLKPQNWELVNPLAPTTVTNDIKSRWDSRTNISVPGQSGYEIGQKVTKNMAAYWEVYLSQASITELLQFDCLFITNHRLVSLSSQDREKLRKVVDAGGIVWIEDCGNMRIDANGPFFLDQLQFSGGAFGGNGGPQVNVPTHPLLNAPFQLSFQEVANLGDKNYGDFSLRSLDTANPGSTIGIPVAPNPETLINIVGNIGQTDSNSGKGLPYIAAGNYGSGAVIATAGDSGCDINDYVGGTNVGSGGNSGAFCGPNLIAAHNEDLKFLYNVVAWGGANNTERRNNRRTASSLETISAPLVRSFDFTNASTVSVPAQVVQSNTAPLIIKNLMIVSGRDKAGTITVRAYDLIPFRDADGDGNYDDGRADLSLGEPYDEIWRVDYPSGGAGLPSAPVYATFSNAAGNIYQAIYVTLPDGSLSVLQFPADTQGGLAAQPVQGAGNSINGGTYDVTVTSGSAPAPVYFENKVFVVEPTGLVVCRDPINGNSLWKTFDGSSPATGETLKPTGTPTLGFNRQDTTAQIGTNSNQSTNDLMLYVPVLSTLGGNNSAKILAYWVGTRNEVQDRKWSNPPDGANGYMDTRVHGGSGGPQQGRYFVAQGGAGSPFVRATVRVYSADIIGPGHTSRENYISNTISQSYKAQANGSGNFIDPDGKVQIVAINGASAPGPGQDVLISVDYDVDYIGSQGTPPQYADNQTQIGARVNNNLTFNNPAFPLSTMAFSPDDLLLFSASQVVNVTTGTAPPISSFVALKEQEGGAANTKMPWRFAFFNPNATTAAGDGLLERTIENTTVRDIAPLRNRLAFAAGWPAVNSAADITKPPISIAPEALTQVQFVGAPITTNFGTTYALAVAQSAANGGPVSVLMAYRTNPEITLTLPESFEPASGVTLLQADASDETNGGTATVVAQGAQEANPNFNLDGKRGRVTVTNFNVNGRYFSASQSFIVRYTPLNSTQQKSVVIAPIPFDEDKSFSKAVDSTGNPASQNAGFTPLLWYYVLPGSPQSSPTLNGDYLFFTLQKTVGGTSSPRVFAIAVDANPAAKDPTIRIGLGEQIRSVVGNIGVETIDNNHVHMASELLGATGSAVGSIGTSAPVGGGESLAINTTSGTYALSGAATLIADAKRVIEVGADASAVWTLDSTLSRLIVGGELPVYDPLGNVLNPPATGRTSLSRGAITKPTVARKLGGSDYLIVDSGNNRAVRTDRSGVVLWNLDKLYDPYEILADGDPLVLSSPSDVQTYVAPTYLASELGSPVTVTGYEIHYLIADTGNSRIIEVADYYDRDGKQAAAPGVSDPNVSKESVGKHIVVYTTRTASAQGRPLRFQSVQRFLGASPSDPTLFGFPYLLAVVSSSTSGGGADSATDFTGGSVVALSYAPYNTAFALRDKTGAGGIARPWIYNASARTTEPRINSIPNGQVQFAANELRIHSTTGGGTIIKKLNKPSFLQQLSLPPSAGSTVPRLVLMICDADGVYAVESQGQQLDVIWYFTQQDYDEINGLRPDNTVAVPAGRLGGLIQPTTPSERRSMMPRFLPASVKLLPSGNYLITNSFAGPSRAMETGRFLGEAFEVQPNGANVLAYVPNPASPPDSARGGRFPVGGFSVPNLQSFNTNGVVRNQQIMGLGTTNTTNPVEQPLYADRP